MLIGTIEGGLVVEQLVEKALEVKSTPTPATTNEQWIKKEQKERNKEKEKEENRENKNKTVKI